MTDHSEQQTPNITTQRQRELIDRLSRLVARRGTEEVEIRQRHAARDAQARQLHDRERSQATAEFERRHAKLVAEYQQAREAAFRRYETEGCELADEESRFAEEAAEDHTEALEVARNLWQHRMEDIRATFLQEETLPQRDLTQFLTQCDHRETELASLVTSAQKVVRGRCQWPDEQAPPPLPPAGLTQQQHGERIAAAESRARAKIHELQQLPTARFLEDGWPVLIFILTAIATVVLLTIFAWQIGVLWIALGSLGVALAITLIVRQSVVPIAWRQTVALIPEFQLAIDQARSELSALRELAKKDAARRQRKLVKRRDRNLNAAQQEWETGSQQQATEHADRLRESATSIQSRRTTIEATHERRLAEIEAQYPPQIEQLEQEFQRRIVGLSAAYRAERAAGRAEFDRWWNDLATNWTAGLTELQNVVGEMNRFCDQHYPRWNDPQWGKWQPAQASPGGPAAGATGDPSASGVAALRFGRFDLNLEAAADEKVRDADLTLPPAAFELPAVLSYPECPSLLLLAEGEGRDAATLAIQNVMLRMLTTFPPGKVRFTIIDPVGLGQNFSAFMHLADYDQRLVTSRIWTESSHIQQRLTDLTEHMENVIQKYLRNEFASIQQYNAHAGEVAEPFQILVIANFPANFSDEAARRLVSIASSGARCGVYTLISVDHRLALPRNFDLADLQSQAATLVWNNELRRFAWQDSELQRLPLTVEAPPGDEQFTSVVRAVGKLAKDTSRVEVPFETVVPPPERWWSGDSRAEIEVPLGRAGAMKLQYLRLGRGTSQHVLIAGKTGSGKSTLLNTIITNLAVHYSPSELEFYLIDFKKGVEFKAYAAAGLPHARVIAIESEREFGLSVLERLDQELKRRGDLFRQEGVQDLKNYRNAQPEAVMPRVLLIIDEFQEFFTSDDKISHDAALLLDRLVRQGRAFGIHVLLGSQTLAGAYSLARSTIGQMAVRIALQCSESDAHLILSEDNTAARLLGRPGEAIYNDANGLIEGNHPFQVVWLSDHDREAYLHRVTSKALEANTPYSRPTVFEGNVPADPSDNELLRTVLQSGGGGSRLAPRTWLGAAVAIKDPTEVVYRRQGGKNLLVVGQHEELALGVLATSLISLGAQFPHSPSPEPAKNGANGSQHPAEEVCAFRRFYLLDGTRPESPAAGFWRKLAGQLPLDLEVVQPRDAAAVVAKIASEVERRLASGEQTAEPLFLSIFNLARFRDLRKSDDFSSFDDDGESANAARQLTTILREGPALGVHALLWCDSYNNLNRWIDRQTLRDLDERVLFQMSATDSSNLMDSPAASRLGVHRAIYYSEEQGQAEKFRPYGLPSSEWLLGVARQLAGQALSPSAVTSG